jgi:hypothetical protein
VPAPTPKPGLSVATQRLEAQATMVAANGIQVASVLAAVLNSLAAGAASPASGAGPCKNGVRITKVPISSARIKVTIEVFYDPNCKTIFNHADLNVALTSAASIHIDGQTTTYDPNGKAVAFGSLQNSTTLGTTATSVTTGSISRSHDGKNALKFGLSCTLANKNSCGFGGIAPLPAIGQSLGVTSALHDFVASGASSGTTQMTAYTGSLNGLKLSSGTGNSWKISGGSKVTDFAGTFREQVNAKSLNVTGSIVLKDLTLNATTSAAFDTRSGVGSGSVTQTSTGKHFASFSTDAVGTGTVHYSDASTDPIVFFIIVSSPNTGG